MTTLSVRAEDELIARLDAQAEQDGVSRSELVIRYLEHGLKTAGLDTVILSTSEIQCLDQLAERADTTRAALSSRYLRERLRREFVDDRNRLLQDAKRKTRTG
jgi:predicted transcriptional regulator